MKNTISNTDDVIDSRDVIARIEELRDEQPIPSSDDDTPEDKDIIDAAAAEWESSEECAELAALEKLAEEAEGYAADWQYGEQLIRDSYFEQAMDEMVADCYSHVIKAADLPFWMTVTLDYSALQQDYTSVDFDGVTYWVR